MTRHLGLIAGLLLSGVALADEARTMPEPLPARSFTLPDPEVRTLSNGVKVIVATNDEVPLWDLRLIFRVGGWTDPEGLEGLASAAVDMMNEGAGERTVEDLERELKRLGGHVGSGASDDASWVTASGLKRNMAPILDVWADVLLHPTFPDEDWELLRARRVAGIASQREDPRGISRVAMARLVWGDTPRGRSSTEASLMAIDTAMMRDFHDRMLHPENAVILVGGSVTADEITPLLEERLAGWTRQGEPVVPTPATPAATEPALYFIDKPGAAQSMIASSTFVGTRLDEDYFDLMLASTAIGETFSSRVNMNLREDKGYTYGARCGLGYSATGPGRWGCSTSVNRPDTGPAMTELLKDVGDALGERPVTAEELTYFTSSLVNGYPKDYETTDGLLGGATDIWLSGLPADWLERYLPGVESTTVDGANAAFRKAISLDRTLWLVVGDKASIFADLQALGLPIHELDRDGNPLETP